MTTSARKSLPGTEVRIKQPIKLQASEARRCFRWSRMEVKAKPDALLSRETLNEVEILEVTGLPPALALQTAMLDVPSAPNVTCDSSILPKIAKEIKQVTALPHGYQVFGPASILTALASGLALRRSSKRSQ